MGFFAVTASPAVDCCKFKTYFLRFFFLVQLESSWASALPIPHAVDCCKLLLPEFKAYFLQFFFLVQVESTALPAVNCCKLRFPEFKMYCLEFFFLVQPEPSWASLQCPVPHAVDCCKLVLPEFKAYFLQFFFLVHWSPRHVLPWTGANWCCRYSKRIAYNSSFSSNWNRDGLFCNSYTSCRLVLQIGVAGIKSIFLTIFLSRPLESTAPPAVDCCKLLLLEFKTYFLQFFYLVLLESSCSSFAVPVPRAVGSCKLLLPESKAFTILCHPTGLQLGSLNCRQGLAVDCYKFILPELKTYCL